MQSSEPLFYAMDDLELYSDPSGPTPEDDSGGASSVHHIGKDVEMAGFLVEQRDSEVRAPHVRLSCRTRQM